MPYRPCLFLVALLLAALVPVATAHDHPGLAAHPTIVSVGDGPWSAPATWSPARVPIAGDVVGIAAGTAVSFDAASTPSLAALGIAPGATLRFRTDRSTALTVGTLVVDAGGRLEIGTPSAPVRADVVAELMIANRAIDTTHDPEQFGTGLIAHGDVRICGARLTPTFVRLAAEPLAGATTLTLSEAVSGWRVGDLLAVPETRQLVGGEKWANYVPQWESRRIAAIAADRRSLTLDAPLTHDHRGARDGAGVLEFLPHIANCSRNVVIRSEDPAGTRGHTMFSGRGMVDIRFCEFRDLGRTTDLPLDSAVLDSSGHATRIGTNQVGRYPVHIHHLAGPLPAAEGGYQFVLLGNAVVRSLKWPIAIHDSHYGLIQANVVFDGQGAGYTTEDGNEWRNAFIGNIGIGIIGRASPRENDGRAGEIFWFKGFHHIVRGNVATSGQGRQQEIVAGCGYKFFWTAATTATTRVPKFRGADVSQAGQYDLVDMQMTPIADFDGNEAYGALASGMTIWHLGTDGYSHRPHAPVSVVRNFRAWHCWEDGCFAYPIQNTVFDGFVVRSDRSRISRHDAPTGWTAGDYWAANVTIRNADVQGTWSAIGGSSNTPGWMVVEDSRFRVAEVVHSHAGLNTFGTKAAMPDRTTVYRRCRFEALPGTAPRSVDMGYVDGITSSNPIGLDRVFLDQVQAIAGGPGQRWQVLFSEQVASHIVPQAHSAPGQFRAGAPVAGLTNSQAWAQYGIAIGGAVAPASASTRADITGLLVALAPGASLPAGTVTPPANAAPPPATGEAATTTTGTSGGSSGNGCGLGGAFGLLLALAFAASRRRSRLDEPRGPEAP